MSDFAERITLDVIGSAVDGKAASGLQQTGAGLQTLVADLKKVADAQGAEATLNGVTAAAGGLTMGAGALAGVLVPLVGTIGTLGVAAEVAFVKFAVSTAMAADENQKLTMQIASAKAVTEDWNAAMEHASQVLPKLEDLSARTGVKTAELAKSFKDISLLTRDSDTQVLKLVQSLSILSGTSGVDLNGLVQRIQQAAISGQLPARGEAGREIMLRFGISGEDLKDAQEAGRLVDYLLERVGQLDAQAADLAGTWSVMGHAMRAMADDAESEIGRSWEPLRLVLGDIVTEARGPLLDAAANAGKLGQALVGMKVAEWAGEWYAAKAAITEVLKSFPELAALANVMAGMAEKAGFTGRGGAPSSTSNAGPKIDPKEYAKAQEEMAKLFHEIDRQHDMAGLDGVDRKLQQISARETEEAGKFQAAWLAAGGTVSDLERGLTTIRETSSKERGRILDAEAEKADRIAQREAERQAREQAAAEARAEKWSAELARNAQKELDLRAGFEMDMARLEDKSSEDRIQQIETAAAREIAAMEKVAQAAKDKAAAIAAAQIVLGDDPAKAEEEMNARILQADTALEEQRSAIRRRSFDEGKILRDEAAGDWEAYYDDLVAAAGRAGDRSYAAIRDALERTAQAAYANAETIAQGWDAGLRQIRASLKSEGQAMADFVTGTWKNVSDGIGNGIYNAISGRTRDLRSALSGIFDGIRADFSKLVQSMIEKWAAGARLWGDKNAGKPGYDENGGHYVEDAGGGGATYVPGSGSGASVGGVVGAAGQGYGYGSSVGSASGAPGWSTGATVGGTAGAIVGTYIFPVLGTAVGAIIGAVIGGIIGALTAKNTEKFINFTSADLMGIDGTARNILGGTINKLTESMQASFSEMFATAGTADRHDLSINVGKILHDYITSMHFVVGAGSDEDIQKDVDLLLGTQLPQELLHTLFGSARTGGKDIPGISGASNYVNNFDPNAPIPKMLEGLGFTATEIERIAGMIDTQAPADFMKYLGSLVNIVVTFNDLAKRAAMTTQEHFTSIRDASSVAPEKAFQDAAVHIRDLGDQLQYLTGDERIKKAQELQQAMGTMFDKADAALASILQSIDAIKQRSDAIKQGAIDALKSPAQREDDLHRSIGNDFGALSTAKTQTQVQQVFDKIQQELSALLNIIVQRINAIKSAQADYAAFRDEMAAANGPQFGTDPGAWMAQNQRQIAEVKAAMASATGDEAIAKARQFLALNRERWQNEFAMLQQVKALSAQIKQSTAAAVFDLELQKLSPHDQGNAMFAKVQELQSQLAGAKTADEVARINSEIQALVSRLAGQEQDPANYNASRDVLIKILKDTEAMSQKVLAGMDKSLTADLSKIGDELKAGETKLAGDLVQAQQDFTDTLAILEAATGMATAKLTGFADAITEVLNGLTQFITDLRSIFTNPNPPTPGTGGGGDGTPTPGPPGSGGGGGTSGDDGPPTPNPHRGTAGGGAFAIPVTVNVTADVRGQTPEETAREMLEAIIAQLQPQLVETIRSNNVQLLRELRNNPRLLTR